MKMTLHLILWLSLLIGRCVALDNGLALTPPMGWLAWERFRCNTDCVKDPENCISEKLFMEMADVMANDSYKDLGYEYVNIDDCWAAKERDSNGRLQADPDRFPSGIAALADYVHKRGLKLGIYGDMGTHTCAGYPGSLGYIETDAQTFAEWGVDMLKLDGCYSNETIYNTGYPNMSRALNATGRPIVFSCSWPAYIKDPNYYVISTFCNLWRNYDDIQDSWDSVKDIIEHYAQNQSTLRPFAGPGHWNDPDQLIIGDFGLSLDQQKAQMAMWAIYAAPLLMSDDLRKMPPESKAILQNKEVIAVNQDKLGIPGILINNKTETREHYIFAKPLSGGNVAVALLCASNDGAPLNMTVSFMEAGLFTNSAMVRDLFDQKDLGIYNNSYTGSVNPMSVRLLLLTPVTPSSSDYKNPQKTML